MKNTLTVHLWSGLVVLALLPFVSSCQERETKAELLTSKYAGKYSYGEDVEKEPVGSIIVYPETDSTVLFFLDICRGAPSYNLGQLYNRLMIIDGEAVFVYTEFEYTGKGCKWQVQLAKDSVTISTLDGQYECGFGNGVWADGIYIKQTTDIPAFFIDGHNDKYFFRATKPENYPE